MIAIIALLAALTVPGVQRVRVAANRAKCATNMRHIGIATMQYIADHDGVFPRTRHSAEASESWIFTLAPYLGEVDDIRISPADPYARERRRRRSTSYILNDIVVDPLTDPFGTPLPGGYGRLSRIPAPTATILAVVISDDRGTGPANDHTHARTWGSFDRLLSDVEADRHRIGSRHASRTLGSAPYLYVDGSVRIFEASEIQAILDSGHNIGEPGQAP